MEDSEFVFDTPSYNAPFDTVTLRVNNAKEHMYYILGCNRKMKHWCTINWEGGTAKYMSAERYEKFSKLPDIRKALNLLNRFALTVYSQTK